nr:hypothetical protein [Tanacetum cinerariifolium]
EVVLSPSVTQVMEHADTHSFDNKWPRESGRQE